MFTPRLTKPQDGNPYYNTISNGGYSNCIKGKPTDKGCNVLANCVGYTVGRFNEIIGRNEIKYYRFAPNAEDFFAQAKKEGLKTGDTPKLGAIICWAKGKPGTGSDGAGHVAVVEAIAVDGSITTSESGYNAKNPFWTKHRYKGGGNWDQKSEYTFLGFIYQPEEQHRVLRKGDKGEDVEMMQARLHALGYLRANEIDGSFGTITLGAVCAFQLEHGLEVDGVCGKATQAALYG